jgi:hypothetical protein
MLIRAPVKPAIFDFAHICFACAGAAGLRKPLSCGLGTTATFFFSGIGGPLVGLVLPMQNVIEGARVLLDLFWSISSLTLFLMFLERSSSFPAALNFIGGANAFSRGVRG